MWRKTTPAKPSSQSPSANPIPPAPVSSSQPVNSAPAAPISPAAPITPQAGPISTPTSSRASSLPVQQFSAANSSAVSSTISSGLKIHGTVSGSGDLTVDSELNGKIWLADSRVSVGSSGRVHADIEARDIVVNGTLHGNLKASESVRFGPSARFEGSVVAPRIGIDDGAKVRGKVETVKPVAEPSRESAVPKSKSAAAKSSPAAAPVASVPTPVSVAASAAASSTPSAAPVVAPAAPAAATEDASKAAAGAASEVTHS
jgi:cytoskeletal protein CcmA (bactofilin family)